MNVINLIIGLMCMEIGFSIGYIMIKLEGLIGGKVKQG
jgi:hypothetical protein